MKHALGALVRERLADLTRTQGGPFQELLLNSEHGRDRIKLSQG